MAPGAAGLDTDPTVLRVSPLAGVVWRDGELQLAVAGSEFLLASDSVAVLRVVHQFARPRTVAQAIAELSSRSGRDACDVRRCVQELVHAGVLVPADQSAPPEVGWDVPSWVFHRWSRVATVRPLPSPGAEPVTAARTASVPLPPPSALVDAPLSELLATRRSRRSWSESPLDARSLSALLWHAARDRGTSGDRLGTSPSRPYPSGGGVYSLELYLAVASGAVAALEGGVFRYQAGAHRLAVVSAHGEAARPFLRRAAGSMGSDEPPIVIVMSSKFAAQSGRYESALAYSLVLKEVGGLLQTLSLVAESLQLAGCALGGGARDEDLNALLDSTRRDEIVVGEFAVGPR